MARGRGPLLLPHKFLLTQLQLGKRAWALRLGPPSSHAGEGAGADAGAHA